MSKAYLARLQAFLESQSPGTGSSSSSTTDSNKRKNPSTENEVDAAASIKDRKQATAMSTHSHTKEGSSERESPEEEDRKGSGRGSKANSTTDKRKEQNRNAQRAFRERKEKVLRDLEDKVSELKEANETTLSENQNLKELVTRLQQENAQLKKAPQSDFTFTMPTANNASSATPDLGHTHGHVDSSSTSTSANANSGASSNNAPHSYSNEDILAFLASAPTVQPSQPAFTMIEPSNVNSGNSGQGSDSWMFDWNSSAFGTELPQAVPPQVTNLSLQPTVDNSFATLWNSLNQQQQQQQQGPSQQFNNNPISTSPVNNLGSGNMPTPPRPQDNNNSAFFSLFHNAFSDPSSSHYTNASGAPNNAHYSGNNNSASNLSAPNGMPSQSMHSSSSAISPASMHNGNNGSRSQSVPSSAVGSNSGPNAQLTRMTSNSTAESPASISSTSDSCPSEAQPGTPSNGASLFAGANGKAPSHTNSLDSTTSSSFLNFAMPAGFTNFYGSQPDAGYKQGYSNAGNSSGFESMFGGSNAMDFTKVTTPSGVFDAMNYRDPLLAGLGSAGDDGLNFASMVANGSNGNPSTGTAPKKNGDVLDFNDFLVASPPSFTQSPPITTGHQERTASGLAKPESRSSSSVPTLGSCSSGTSPMSNQPSPYMNASASYANSAGTVSNTGTPDWLPWDIAHDHPLIAHVMKDAPSQEETEAANRRLALRGISPTHYEVDTLCNDMMLKATCKEAARDRIAKAMQTDEMTMKLYAEYLQSKAGNTQK